MGNWAKTMIVASAAVLVTASTSVAEGESWLPGELSGNVGVVTDYSFRGVSQTQRDMALQGGMDWAHDSGFFLGLWGSSIRFGGDESYLEQDFYGGWGTEIGALSFDVNATFFFYPKEESYNYWEYAVNAGYDLDVVALSLGFLVSDDYFGSLGTGTYVSGGIEVPIPLDIDAFELTFDAGVGYTNTDENIDDDDNYVDFQFGIVQALPFNLSLDYRIVGTDADGLGDIADTRFIFGAFYEF